MIDQGKVAAETRLDGKFLLSSSDDSLLAADMARLYKGLLEVEDSWREMKQTLEPRPVHHRKEERIRAHVTLCFLGLMLMRVAERRDQRHLAQLPAGTRSHAPRHLRRPGGQRHPANRDHAAPSARSSATWRSPSRRWSSDSRHPAHAGQRGPRRHCRDWTSPRRAW